MRPPGLVAQPWKPGSLAAIGRRDSALIVGTGLTMADVVASLERAGHKGEITAISRRGLLPRAHGRFQDGVKALNGNAYPETAVELLRSVRRTIRAYAGATDWQSVVDAVRGNLPIIWRSLPPKEQLRVVRRLLPFWEVHRFRISPQTHGAVVRSLGDQRLSIERAAILSLDVENGKLAAVLSDAHSARAASIRSSSALDRQRRSPRNRCWLVLSMTGLAKSTTSGWA